MMAWVQNSDMLSYIDKPIWFSFCVFTTDFHLSFC